MPTNNMINLSHQNTHVSGSATLTLKSLTEFVIDWCRSFSRN